MVTLALLGDVMVGTGGERGDPPPRARILLGGHASRSAPVAIANLECASPGTIARGRRRRRSFTSGRIRPPSRSSRPATSTNWSSPTVLESAYDGLGHLAASMSAKGVRPWQKVNLTLIARPKSRRSPRFRLLRLRFCPERRRKAALRSPRSRRSEVGPRSDPVAVRPDPANSEDSRRMKRRTCGGVN